MAENDALILIVEDEPQMRRFLIATLTGHGYANGRKYPSSSSPLAVRSRTRSTRWISGRTTT
jgi:CheY-like chemotaxis protein